jgi:hypothetical protein
LAESSPAVDSYGPRQVVANGSVKLPIGKPPLPDSAVHGVKCPISYSVRIPLCSGVHGVMFNQCSAVFGFEIVWDAVAVALFVSMNPFAADACIKPVWPVERSVIIASKACPPPVTAASKMWILRRSPGSIRNVCALGVKVAKLAVCGPGGPVGVPSLWISAKLNGSMQLLLQL